MKIKTPTSVKGKANKTNGTPLKVEKKTTPLKTPAGDGVTKPNKTPGKKLTAKKKLIQVKEEDEEIEHEEAPNQYVKLANAKTKLPKNDAGSSEDEHVQDKKNTPAIKKAKLLKKTATIKKEDDSDEEEEKVVKDEKPRKKGKEKPLLIKKEEDSEQEEEEENGADGDGDEDDEVEQDTAKEEEEDNSTEEDGDDNAEDAGDDNVEDDEDSDHKIGKFESDDETPEETAISRNSVEEDGDSSLVITNLKTIPKDTPWENKIHIKNLPCVGVFNHSDLASVFSKYGKMTACVIYPGVNSATAMIAYTTAESATAALAANKRIKIKDKLITVYINTKHKHAFKNELSIYVSKLPKDITEEMLKEHFAQTGTISKIWINPIRGKKFAFIEFANEESLKNALKLDGSKLNENAIEIKMKTARETPTDEKKKNLNVIAIENKNKWETFEEKKLQKIFSKCGKIVDIDVICRSDVLAYITFEDSESVEKALNLNGMIHHGLQLNIVTDSTYKPDKYTIYVQNIPTGTDEEILKNFFSECGEVKSVFIYKLKRAAKVEFYSKESYCKAFLLNEHCIKLAPIYIQPYSKYAQNMKRPSYSKAVVKPFQFSKRSFNNSNKNPKFIKQELGVDIKKEIKQENGTQEKIGKKRPNKSQTAMEPKPAKTFKRSKTD